MEAINTFWSQIAYAVAHIRVFDIIDILALAFIIYKAVEFFKETRAGQLIKGIVVLLLLFLVSFWFDLVTIKWLLIKLANSAIIIVAIIFQPELRRALERVGTSKISPLSRVKTISDANAVTSKCIAAVCRAAGNMQENKIGALIVFERQIMINEIVSTGTVIDAEASSELIQNVFFPKSPLHDGGMVVRLGRVIAAGCILPLTADSGLNSNLGTRHRAAIGMSENSDAVVVVVSEETGTVSLAVDGVLKRNYNAISLQEELEKLLLITADEEKPFYAKAYGKVKKVITNKQEKKNEN